MLKKQVKKTKIPPKVAKYLEQAGISHEIIEHRTVYTAIDAAATMKKKINEIIKSLLIKADKDYYLVLLPADNNLDLEKLKKVISKFQAKEVKVIKIPGEKIVDKAFKVKSGAMSAFGSVYKVGVVLEKKLEKLSKAVFATGSHNHSVEMKVKDYIKLENPLAGVFGKKKNIKKQKLTKPKKRLGKKPAKKLAAKRKKK